MPLLRIILSALALVATPALAGDRAHPTVIELFESQGCSVTVAAVRANDRP